MLKKGTESSFFSNLIDSPAAKNLLWLIAGANSRQLVLFVINVYMMRVLGEKYFGLISFGYALMLVFNGIGDFGLRTMAWRELARVRDSHLQFRKRVGVYLGTRMITTAVTFIFFVLFILLLRRPAEEKFVLFLFSFGIFFSQITFDWPFRAVDKMNIPAASSFIFGVVFLLTSFLFISGPSKAFLFPLFFGLSNLISICYLFYFFIKNFGSPLLRFDTERIVTLLKESYHLGINTAVIRLYAWYPLILLGLFLNDAMLGKFRIAHLIYTFLISFSLYFTGSIFSRASSAFVRDDLQEIKTTVIRTVYLSLLGFVPICILLFLFSDEAITLLFGASAASNRGLLRILLLIAPVTILGNFFRELLIVINRQDVMLRLNIISLLISVLLLPTLIYLYDLTGLAIGIAIVESLSFGITYLYYKFYVGKYLHYFIRKQ